MHASQWLCEFFVERASSWPHLRVNVSPSWLFPVELCSISAFRSSSAMQLVLEKVCSWQIQSRTLHTSKTDTCTDVHTYTQHAQTRILNSALQHATRDLLSDFLAFVLGEHKLQGFIRAMSTVLARDGANTTTTRVGVYGAGWRLLHSASLL